MCAAVCVAVCVWCLDIDQVHSIITCFSYLSSGVDIIYLEVYDEVTMEIRHIVITCLSLSTVSRPVQLFPQPPPPLLLSSKQITVSPAICECFNSYFIDIGRNLSKDDNCSTNPLTYVDSYHNTSLFVSPTNQY